MLSLEEKINWAKIKADYVSGKYTYRQLAEKYKISFSTLSKKAKKNKWVSLKRKREERVAKNVQQKLEEKQTKEIVKDIDRICEVARKLIAKADKAIEELDLYNVKEKTVTKKTKYRTDTKIKAPIEDVEKTTEKLRIEKGVTNTKSLKNIASALSDIKSILAPENAAEDIETGVIILPQQEVLTPPEDREDE